MRCLKDGLLVDPIEEWVQRRYIGRVLAEGLQGRNDVELVGRSVCHVTLLQNARARRKPWRVFLVLAWRPKIGKKQI